MEDAAIVALYWERDEQAIPATAAKYGPYCTAVAANILQSAEDVDECVNDTWLGAWNAMPPHRPAKLSAFLGKLTRNLAINRCRYNNAQKRNVQLQAVLTELEECTGGDPQQQLDQRELGEAINGFLEELSPGKRRIFLLRYWYAEPIERIAKERFMTQAAVTMQLARMRSRLRTYLTERGFDL